MTRALPALPVALPASANGAAPARSVPDSESPLGSSSDSAVAARAARGDVAAFGVLVERYQRPMAALVSRMTANQDDVDDIVQELFIRAWKGLPRFRGDAQFSTWLYRIAVNTALKHRSHRRSEAALSLSAEDAPGGMEALSAPKDAPAHQGGDPYRAVESQEQKTRIRGAVLSLPEKQRVVVALHYFEGQSCEEISEVIGCSVGTVWSRLHYACKRLKGLLETSEVGG
ncbi:MAG: sigma-70 family RNA polymerase sigma factor [Cytophagales bacterium]|nr:sigma-70 family RNA polymerase sigma factor [Armatimonadota bacterium]